MTFFSIEQAHQLLVSNLFGIGEGVAYPDSSKKASLPAMNIFVELSDIKRSY